MGYLAEFDELHPLGKDLVAKDAEEAMGIIEDLLIYAYMQGRRKGYDDLDFDEEYILYYEDMLKEKAERMYETIYKEFDGENVEDRVRKYVEAKDAEALQRVIETEYHRDYNAGISDLGDDFTEEHPREGVYKRWNTMMDDRVRDTHEYLQSMEVPMDDKFHTYDGDEALYPGNFSNPSNNINCRCTISIFRAVRQGRR